MSRHPSPLTPQAKLNKSTPAAADVGLGDTLNDLTVNLNALITDVTAIRTKLIAALGKLDADAGVTDTNYTSLESPAAITAATITDLNSR